jgi:hypothetical protein
MTKAAILISAILLFAGVAAAGTLTGSGHSDTPTLDTPTLSTPTGAAPQENPQTGEISGPCDEAEHASDPRCTGAAGAAQREDADDDRGNSGPGNAHDSSGNRGGNSGPGGDDDD